MAVLQKMRDKFGLAISIIIALSLLYFIAPMDDLMNMFGSRKTTVGVISGKKISYEDFNAETEKFKTVARMGGGDVSEEDNFRNMAWEYFIYRYLFVENAKKAGITVGNDELVDCISGDHISPVLAGNRLFMGADGNFSRDNLNALIAGAAEQAEFDVYWKYLQNTVNIQQYVTKYNTLFVNGAVCNDLLAKAEMAFNNSSADVDYVEYQYPFITDTTIVVKSGEIKNYYNAHKENYKQTESRDIEFVLYEVTPSAADIAKASDAINEAYDEFCTTAKMKNFLSKNSDKPYADTWYKPGELKSVSAQLDQQVFTDGKAVTGIVRDGDTFRAARVMESALVPDSVYVKHILLQGTAATKADSLLAVLQKGADFADLAARFSADQNSADEGVKGNIGWMTQTYMIPGFESVLTAAVGKPYIVKTMYGNHIVAVSKRTTPVAKKKVAVLEKAAYASSETHNVIYADAKRLAILSGGKLEGYRAAVDSLGVYSQKRAKISRSNTRYGSAEDTGKAVARWAFEAKPGKVSDVIEIGGYYVVAAVTAARNDGYTPVEEVAESIKNTLYTRKLHDKVKAEVAEKIAGKTTLAEVAEALGTSVTSEKEVSLATGRGNLEPALSGAVLAATDGQLSGPVAGSRAVYVFVATNRQEQSFYTKEDAQTETAQKAQYCTRFFEPIMSKEADVKDNRAKFY